MAKSEFDTEDVGMLVLGLFAVASMVGVAEVSAFGVSMSDSFTIAGYTASLSWILAVGTFAGTIITNDHTDLLTTDAITNLQDSSMDDMYVYAVLASAALLIGWVFVPQVPEFVTSQDLWSVAYIGVVATSQVALGWIY